MADSHDLTTRDVFEQVDRRLTRVEDDLRSFRADVDARFVRVEKGLLDVRRELSYKIDRNFRWMTGMIMVSWLSTMSAVLLK